MRSFKKTTRISAKKRPSNTARLAQASASALETLEKRVLMSSTIAGWNFDQYTPITTNVIITPTASTGSSISSATSVGLQSSSTYGTGSTYLYPNPQASGTGDISDVPNGSGNNSKLNPTDYSSTGATGNGDATGTNPAWRLRGNNDGWSSNATIASQGAQFNVNTGGYSSVTLSFDLDPSSASAPSEVAVQYTTDGTHWLEAPTLTAGTGSNGTTDGITVATNSSNTNIVSGEYFQVANNADALNWQDGETATFPSAAANDPNFAVRIVNAATGGAEFEVTGTGKTLVAYPTAGAGNWRLDNVVVSGVSAVGPAIGTQPTSQTVLAGSNATFTAAATDNDGSTPTVQWYEGLAGSGTAVPGATSTTLTITNANASESGYTYYAVVTNPNNGNTSTSNAATLTVDTAPVITVQPAAQTAAVGTEASFVAAASGTPTPTVQWYSDTTGLDSGGTLISGATNAAYSVPATSALNGTYYYAVFSNANANAVANTATTSAVELTTVSAAHTIAQWSFTQTVSPVDSSPAPSFGSGTLAPLGMANDYNNGNSNDDEDVTNSATTSATVSTANPDGSDLTSTTNEYTWRVRGLASGGQNNGWSNAAPEYTQGAEVDVPVSGYDDLSLSFDWYSTTQGVRDLQVQYYDPLTSAWTNAGATFTATSDDYYGVSTNVNSATGTGTPTPVFVNLQGVSDLSGVSTLKLRMVSAYDTSLPTIDDANALDSNPHGQYASAAVYAVNEQQELNFLNASSGTFTLSYAGQTTAPISYSQGDADLTSTVGSASAIAGALNALPAIEEAGGVTVINPAAGTDSTGAVADDYTVTFNDPSNVPEQAIAASTSGMNTGTTLTVQASTNGVVQYNNTSGNWRFDNIIVEGDKINNSPVVVTNPTNQTYTEGVSTSVTFAASAYSDTQATDPILVTWEDAPAGSSTFTPISGEQNLSTTISNGVSNASLTLTNVPLSLNGEQYEAVFTNSDGSATTTAAALSVVGAVGSTITVNPTSTSVLVGDQVTFTAAETGGQPTPTVQWLENGQPVSGSDIVSTTGTSTVSSTLTLTAAEADSGASFVAVFSNAGGTEDTTAATLSVLPPEASITQWSFPATVAAGDNTPAPTLNYAGAGNYETDNLTSGASLTSVGFTPANTGVIGETPSDDVTQTAGTAEASFSEYLWRVRNAAGGWDNSAPNDTEGAQVSVDTTGYSNVYMTFDWYTTTQGIRDLQEEYSTNGGTSWTLLGSPLVATPNDYYGANGNENVSHIPVVFDLTGVPAANDNPNLELRVVSSYDPTVLNAQGQPYEYTSATLGTGGVPVKYNGTSGNWRFGNFSIDAIPDWLSAASAYNATWNPANNTLTVTGAATINADPGFNTAISPTAEPSIVADVAAAALSFTPTSGTATDFHTAGLTLGNGATADETSLGDARTHTNHDVLVIGSVGATSTPTFSIDTANNSALDVEDNDLIIHDDGNQPSIESWALLGRNYDNATSYAQWNGAGIRSTVAGETNSPGTEVVGLAVVLNSDLNYESSQMSSFDGETLRSDGQDIVVKYDYIADVDLNGKVDASDYNILSGNLGQTDGSGNPQVFPSSWIFGDCNYDGFVDSSDYNILSGYLGLGSGGDNGPQL